MDWMIVVSVIALCQAAALVAARLVLSVVLRLVEAGSITRAIE
jgi:hypothetical protein